MEAEVDAINEAMAGHRAALAEMPAQRSALLLGDDADEALDRLELSERSAYRKLERGTMQIAALEGRMAEMRRAAIAPLINRHRAALMAASEKVEATLRAAMQANAEAASILADAVAELGQNDANMLLPVVEFAGMLDERCLEAWRWRLDDQNARIDRQHGGARP